MKRVRGFEEDAHIAGAQVRACNRRWQPGQDRTSSDADQVKLRELEIDAKTARDQLESYLTKYREAISREAENALPANGRVIAFAMTLVTPTFPKLGPTLLLAPLGGAFVSLGGGRPHPARRRRRSRPPPRRRSRPRRRSVASRTAVRHRPAPPPPTRASPRRPREESARERTPGRPRSKLRRPARRHQRRREPAAARRRRRRGWRAAGGAGRGAPADAARRDGARRLGPSPTWLADLFDRERDGGAVRTGLSDLVADVGACPRRPSRSLDAARR